MSYFSHSNEAGPAGKSLIRASASVALCSSSEANATGVTLALDAGDPAWTYSRSWYFDVTIEVGGENVDADDIDILRIIQLKEQEFRAAHRKIVGDE